MKQETIESFKKGLELGLVPSSVSLGDLRVRPKTITGSLEPITYEIEGLVPTELEIEAMEGLAGRVLIGRGRYIDFNHEDGCWELLDSGGYICDMPGTHDDTLTPLVAAVERLRG